MLLKKVVCPWFQGICLVPWHTYCPEYTVRVCGSVRGSWISVLRLWNLHRPLATPKKDILRKRDLKQSRNAANYCGRNLFLKRWNFRWDNTFNVLHNLWTVLYKYSLTLRLLQTSYTLHQQLDTSFPRNETVRHRSQFLHLCICERFIYFLNQSAYFAILRLRTNRGNL